jgi:hypothetical protein
MLRAAFDWLIENRAGTAEIWIASDNQRSNWMPEDARWKSVIAQLSGLSQKVRVRLLELNQAPEDNASIAIKELLRRPRGDQSELEMTLEVQRNRMAPASIPVTLTLDGERSSTELKLDGQSLRWRRKIDLGSRRQGGWGSFALPADANPRDDTAYFVYGPDVPLLAAVVSADKQGARDFQFAAASRGAGHPDFPGRLRQRQPGRQIALNLAGAAAFRRRRRAGEIVRGGRRCRHFLSAGTGRPAAI